LHAAATDPGMIGFAQRDGRRVVNHRAGLHRRYARHADIARENQGSRALARLRETSGDEQLVQAGLGHTCGKLEVRSLKLEARKVLSLVYFFLVRSPCRPRPIEKRPRASAPHTSNFELPTSNLALPFKAPRRNFAEPSREAGRL